VLPSGITTPDEIFHYKIKNYWYANNYAYLLYFLILLAIVIIIIKTRTSLLVMERDSLEELVNERTGKLLSLNNELSSKNQQLISTNLQLEQLDREKSEYLGIVAHDLKNPLSGVLGFAEIISDEVDELDEEEITRYAENIRISSTSMLDIINKLLDIDRMEQGKLDIVLHDFDLTKLIEETIESNLPHSKRKGITIRFNAPDESLYINSDRNLIYQIIDNLISNAVKYSYNNSTVNIRFTGEEDIVLLEVEDHGVGIPADEFKYLFKKFSKLSSRPTAGESSTGLGLSIVNMLVKLLGGNISCSSKPGFGSTFTLTLPKRNGYRI
jgi:signal transduction histidine kinase